MKLRFKCYRRNVCSCNSSVDEPQSRVFQFRFFVTAVLNPPEVTRISADVLAKGGSSGKASDVKMISQDLSLLLWPLSVVFTEMSHA